MQIKKAAHAAGNKKRRQNVAFILTQYYTTNRVKNQPKLASGFWAEYIVVMKLGGLLATGDIHW